MEKSLEYNLSRNSSRIVKFIFKGLTVTQMANELNCSRSNVSYHIKTLYKKYRATSRSEFILSVFGKILDTHKTTILKLKAENEKYFNENEDLKKLIYNLLLNRKNPENLRFWLSEIKKYF